MKDITYSGHVVICGWNDRVPRIVERYLEAERYFETTRKSRRLVVLDSRFRDQLDHVRELERRHSRKELDFIDGEATNPGDLQKASIEKASTILLVADERTRIADERTQLRALAISRYCREKAHRLADQIYIIAEINNDEYRDSLLECDVNEVLCSTELAESIMVQSTFNHGLSDVLRELLSYNQVNEFYLVDASDYPWVEKKTFNEVLPVFRSEYKVLLVGIKVILLDENERKAGRMREVIDRGVLRDMLQKRFHIDRQILCNPLTVRENEYQIRKEDQLLVLAADEASVRKARDHPVKAALAVQ